MKNEIILYRPNELAEHVEVRIDEETVWLNQEQIVQLFQRDQSVISRHIRNVFNEGELDEKSNMQKMHNASSAKPIALYSLDVILGVGYRTNSKVAIEFRRWATKTLRSYIVDGFAINKNRIAKNYTQFLSVVDSIKNLLPTALVSG